MTLKDTVKSNLIMYPLISPSKLSVYNHLFLTIGNGYEWITYLDLLMDTLLSLILLCLLMS